MGSDDCEQPGEQAELQAEETAKVPGQKSFISFRLPPATASLTIGVLGAFCMVAVLQRRSSSGAGPTTHQRPMRRLSGDLIDWDESKGVLAREAVGMPGMPSMEAIFPSHVYGGTIGDWNGGPPPSTATLPSSSNARCRRNEELFLGVCYKNCSLLTGGLYPIRFAPNGCCKDLPCMTPSEVDMQGFAPGTGYIVSAEGNGHYPHQPGECRANEEEHLGYCYKKCELLTNGAFPKRVAANTCCKQSPCWNPFNLDTKGKYCEGYGVGGGASTDDQCPHRKMSP